MRQCHKLLESFNRSNRKQHDECVIAACHTGRSVACSMRRLSTRFSLSNVVAQSPIRYGSVRLVSFNMEWKIEETTHFIEDYHNSPELWDNRSVVYRDNKLKYDKLSLLASKYNCSVTDIKKKIKNLRSAFHRERNKLETSKKSGSSPSKKKTWFGYDLLGFLRDVDLPRPTTSTSSDTVDCEVNFFIVHKPRCIAIYRPTNKKEIY